MASKIISKLSIDSGLTMGMWMSCLNSHARKSDDSSSSTRSRRERSRGLQFSGSHRGATWGMNSGTVSTDASWGWGHSTPFTMETQAFMGGGSIVQWVSEGFLGSVEPPVATAECILQNSGTHQWEVKWHCIVSWLYQRLYHRSFWSWYVICWQLVPLGLQRPWIRVSRNSTGSDAREMWLVGVGVVRHAWHKEDPLVSPEHQCHQCNVGAPMKWAFIDRLRPLHETERGNQLILIATDNFSKWPVAFPLPDQEAMMVAEALMNGFFSWFGVSPELQWPLKIQIFQKIRSLLWIQETEDRIASSKWWDVGAP